MVFYLPRVPILLYRSKYINNLYISYSYVMKYPTVVKISRIHIFYIYICSKYVEFIVVLYLLDKLEIRNEK